MEGELRRFTDELLEVGGVVQTRKLNENAVGALAHDRRFRGSEIVDAPVDRFDRRRGRIRDALTKALIAFLDDDRSRFCSRRHLNVVSPRSE